MKKMYAKIITYFLVIVLCTVIAVMFLEAEIIHDYLENNKNKALLSDFNLITATLVANNRGEKEIAVFSDPILNNESNYSRVNTLFDLSIYAVFEFDELSYENGFVIIINNIKNTDISKDSSITAKLMISNANKTDYRVINAEFIDGYSQDLKLMFLRNSSINSIYNEGTVSQIQLYEVEGVKETLLFTISSNTGSSDDEIVYVDLYKGFNTDINNHYKLFQNDDSYFYDEYWIEDFNSYSIRFLYLISVEFIIVGATTIYLFFPKSIKKYVLKKCGT
jgi:hypothetical protein